MNHPPAHAPRTPFLLLIGGLIVGGMCALLALNTASAANELSRHDLALKDAAIAAQLQQLRNDVAASEAPGNLAKVASQLGMVPAGNPAFLKVLPDGRVVVLGSPSPVTAPPLPAPPTSSAPKTSPPAHPKPPATGAKNKTATKQPASPPPTPTPTTTLPGGTR